MLIDWVVAVGLTSFALLSVFIAADVLPADEVDVRVPWWVAYVLTVAMTMPLAWRRRRPVEVLAVVGALFVVYRLAKVPEGTLSTITIFLALFSAGAYSIHPARDWVRGGVVAASFALVSWQLLEANDFVTFDALVLGGFTVGFNVAFFAAGWLLGDAWRTRRAHERELERRAVALAREREDRARRAVLDERVRIARELHDVVAHHVSVMGVQAAGARRVLATDRDRASEALAAVEDSSRKAVSELQRLVGFLRDADADSDGDGVGVGPQPTLDEVDALVASSGVPAQLRWVGRARPVPSSVALSAYRIIQESLTNARKHAGAVETTVVVTYGADTLQVEVVNAAPTHARTEGRAHGLGAGRGLLGMRERVTMLGGRFEHGPIEGGRYRVFASLPTADAFDDDRPQIIASVDAR
jgi:signal transduction histidine kinase